jgi:hypothetical protein
MTSKQPPMFDPANYAINPASGQVVKKSGPTYFRLVKFGVVTDAEFEKGLQEKALARKKAATEKKAATLEEKKAAKQTKPAAAKARRVARKVVDAHRSELDDLESDAADERLRTLLANRLSLAANTTTDAGSSESDDDKTPPASASKKKPAPRKLTDRIRLKSQPIPIPSKRGELLGDRRAALRQSLALPIDSEED